MKIKQISTIVLAAVLCLSAVSCCDSSSSSSNAKPSATTSAVAEKKSESGETTTTETETEKDTIGSEKKSKNAKLSDNLLDFQVSVNGSVVSFPCSVKELAKAGFEIDKSYTTKISAGKHNYMRFVCDDVKIHAHVYNFSDNSYDLTKDTGGDDVIVSDITIYSSEIGSSEVLLPKGLNVSDATMKTFQETYGKPDIENGFGIVYYCGDHFNGDIVWNKSDSQLYHSDGEKKKCNYFIEVCPVESETDSKLQYIRLASSEEVVESFYEKYPDQIKK